MQCTRVQDSRAVPCFSVPSCALPSRAEPCRAALSRAAPSQCFRAQPHDAYEAGCSCCHDAPVCALSRTCHSCNSSICSHDAPHMLERWRCSYWKSSIIIYHRARVGDDDDDDDDDDAVTVSSCRHYRNRQECKRLWVILSAFWGCSSTLYLLRMRGQEEMPNDQTIWISLP